jgi:hypothetical protein
MKYFLIWFAKDMIYNYKYCNNMKWSMSKLWYAKKWHELHINVIIINNTQIITIASKCISQKCLIAYEQVHMQSRLKKIWWCKCANCVTCMIIYVEYCCIKWKKMQNAILQKIWLIYYCWNNLLKVLIWKCAHAFSINNKVNYHHSKMFNEQRWYTNHNKKQKKIKMCLLTCDTV